MKLRGKWKKGIEPFGAVPVSQQQASTFHDQKNTRLSLNDHVLTNTASAETCETYETNMKHL